MQLIGEVKGVATITNPVSSCAIVASRAGHGSLTPTKAVDIRLPEPLDEKSRTATSYGTWRRCGPYAIVALLLGSLLVLAIAAFMVFLWLASYKSPFWQSIIVRNWLPMLVTICSLVLRQIVDVQAAICTAMLASLVLETSGALITDTALCTLIKAKARSADIFDLIPIYFNGSTNRRRSTFHLAMLILGLTCTTVFIQFTSFVLMSDIGVGDVPSPHVVSDMRYTRNIAATGSNFDNLIEPGPFRTNWVRKPNSYPPFAEYAEPITEQEGVDDTGLTLRAFLPFETVQDRERLREFAGKTTVFDSRVSCQMPEVENITISKDLELPALLIGGSIRATQEVFKMDNSTAFDPRLGIEQSPPGTLYNETAASFSCMAFSESSGGSYKKSDEWKTSLCQLPNGGANSQIFSGNLISEFVEPSQYRHNLYKRTGEAYLVLNFTSGSLLDWSPRLSLSVLDDSTVTKRHRGIWLDLVSNDADDAQTSQEQVVSLTLCYSAFNTSILNVTVKSQHPRTEPVAAYDSDKTIYSFDGVRSQLGQGNRTAEHRGILSLQRKSSWLASERSFELDQRSTAQQFADLGGKLDWSATGNITAPLYLASTGWAWRKEHHYTYPHTSHILLFQEIIHHGGSVSFALQSLFTVLASMDYYDHLPMFNITSPAVQASFLPASIPMRTNGMTAILITLIAHLAMCAITATLFVAHSKWSELRNPWQSISQLLCSETVGILSNASNVSKVEVKKMFERSGLSRDMVILARNDETSRVEIQRIPPDFGQPHVRRRGWTLRNTLRQSRRS